MTRRSKRKSLVAIRCSARQQARQQQDAEIYGSDYGILPSGASVFGVFPLFVWVRVWL